MTILPRYNIVWLWLEKCLEQNCSIICFRWCFWLACFRCPIRCPPCKPCGWMRSCTPQAGLLKLTQQRKIPPVHAVMQFARFHQRAPLGFLNLFTLPYMGVVTEFHIPLLSLDQFTFKLQFRLPKPKTSPYLYPSITPALPGTCARGKCQPHLIGDIWFALMCKCMMDVKRSL